MIEQIIRRIKNDSSDRPTGEPTDSVWTDDEIRTVASYASILARREQGLSKLIDPVGFRIIMPGLPHFGENFEGIGLTDASSPVRLKEIIVRKKSVSSSVIGVGFGFEHGDNRTPLTKEEAQATEKFIDAAIWSGKYSIRADWSGINKWTEADELATPKLLRVRIERYDRNEGVSPWYSYKVQLTGLDKYIEPFTPKELTKARKSFYKALVTPGTDVGFRLIHL